MKINLNEDKSCLKRAIFTGLRYIGIDDDCSWVPVNPTYKETVEICAGLVQKYPLLRIYHEETFSMNNEPILMIHKMGETIQGEKLGQGHALFCSDVYSLPKNIACAVLGWENYL